ncbi:hypothetical protein [Halanaerobium hydrogeniformans]|uniref:Uncharacterized protein n=1 Tax=Halanaerobium hydrogeniformans TaxID=656519 RepID=E4RLE6_HALHG|nr:hypothetical protein [Halanaerobium hydrogeniformans]ADQ14860.1 hypothetical protein Halsa_1433 [Halanaerobium hydrogeniformans]
MNKKIIILVILSFVLIFSLPFSVLAEENEKDLYSGKEFRNPFVESPVIQVEREAEERPAEPVITFADIRRELPFNLDGIISSGTDRIALIDVGDRVELVRGYYSKDGYELISIERDSVIVRNRGFRFRLKIGGEVDER